MQKTCTLQKFYFSLDPNNLKLYCFSVLVFVLFVLSTYHVRRCEWCRSPLDMSKIGVYPRLASKGPESPS